MRPGEQKKKLHRENIFYSTMQNKFHQNVVRLSSSFVYKCFENKRDNKTKFRHSENEWLSGSIKINFFYMEIQIQRWINWNKWLKTNIQIYWMVLFTSMTSDAHRGGFISWYLEFGSVPVSTWLHRRSCLFHCGIGEDIPMWLRFTDQCQIEWNNWQNHLSYCGIFLSLIPVHSSQRDQPRKWSSIASVSREIWHELYTYDYIWVGTRRKSNLS